MAVSTMMTPNATMQEWKTMFPDFTTLQGSCLFIKKLIAVSLSSISYIRGIFPEKAYGERNLYGLRLKLLSEDCGLKSVSKFIDLVRGCYDAVDKKYLQQLSIGICQNKENQNEVIEAYNLVFAYKDDECSLTYQNKTKTFSPEMTDPTVEASLLMLKNITAISDLLGELPKNVYLSLKLLYYDDVTPDDYEPPGFQSSIHPKFTFPAKTMNIALGKIDTEIHGFKFLLKTTLNKKSYSHNDAEDPLQVSQASTNAEENICDDDISREVFESEQSPQGSPSRNVYESIKISGALKCPCKSKSTTDDDIIVCTSCERLQHKACYGILSPENMPSTFYCVDCIVHNTDGESSGDFVYTYQGKEREEFCATRRAIVFFLHLNSVTVSSMIKLFGYNKRKTNALLQRLASAGFIKQIPGTENYIVQESRVTKNHRKYFLDSYGNENEMEKNSKTESKQKLPSPLTCQPHSPRTATPPVETSNLESSIKKVSLLSLNNMSPIQDKRNSRKRKVSNKVLSNDDSGEIFPSQIRTRSKKKKHE